jgi:hypothetical protein
LTLKKCIAGNFNGSNFVKKHDKEKVLERLRFQNGDTIPNIKELLK